MRLHAAGLFIGIMFMVAARCAADPTPTPTPVFGVIAATITPGNGINVLIVAEGYTAAQQQ